MTNVTNQGGEVELAFANKQVKTWMDAEEKYWEFLSEKEERGISVNLTNSSMLHCKYKV